MFYDNESALSNWDRRLRMQATDPQESVIRETRLNLDYWHFYLLSAGQIFLIIQ